ncbi:MAG TPA: cobyrinate a,c-diamide synthase, partial [Syntrophales bacterium]
MIIAAVRGGAGKTALSLGLAAAWRHRGRKVAPFKKGPDYIDAAWLSQGAGRLCRNLDTFLMSREKVRLSFWRHAPADGISLIEGNRGLYDGVDAEGSHSTAELAKLLRAPVILVIDGDKITRTAAALVLGCQKLDPEVDLKGVILNRVARLRQEEILRKAIETSCRLPILGAMPRMENFLFPERHLGLLPPQEHAWVEKALDLAREAAEKYLDLDTIEAVARGAEPFFPAKEKEGPPARAGNSGTPVIGVIKDSAFQFYYPENLEALMERGARVVEVSAIQEKVLPPVDGLYIGGGFPETHARLLSENSAFRSSLRKAAEDGLPVYAECGGLMYLGESLTLRGEDFPMVGLFPVSFSMERRPQGHGYTLLEVDRENPFFPPGTGLKGHEFHYSRPVHWREDRISFAYRVKRGWGFDGKRDGLCYKNVLATYSHLHALGCEEWADGFVDAAVKWRRTSRV